MPFKSQRRKFAQLLVEGKISDQTFEDGIERPAAYAPARHARRSPAGGMREPSTHRPMRLRLNLVVNGFRRQCVQANGEGDGALGTPT